MLHRSCIPSSARIPTAHAAKPMGAAPSFQRSPSAPHPLPASAIARPSSASVSAPSSWQRASTEANRNLEATAPRFSRPPEPPSAGQPQLRPSGKRKGDTFSVPPALHQQGWARMYSRSTRCETTPAPGFAQARFNYQAAGACDCPSHLMKAHLPSSRQHWSLLQLFALLPNSRFELHPARPDAFLAQ